MNKLFPYLMTMALFGISLFSSCSDDDDVLEEQKVLVKFTATPSIEGTIPAEAYEGLVAVFTEVRNQDTTHCVLNASGVGSVNLYKCIYNIAIEDKIKNEENKDVTISVRMENISVNEAGQEIVGRLNSLPADAIGQNFIFGEVFFNGERNSGRMMHPDQYFTIFNPTEDTLYVDGVSVAVTQHLSWQEPQLWYNKYYPSRVPVGGFVTIPGAGQDHPVLPGEKVVVAFTAVDHSKVEGYDHAVDLTGADYEIYYGPEVKGEVDNPDVENVVISENPDSYGFFFQPRGYVSPLMFKLENGEKSTIEKFYKDNMSETLHAVPADEEKGTPADTISIQIISVPTEMIIDGVQTSDVPQDVKTRVIPETVDRGKFLVNGCHRQELAIRKEIKVGKKVFYQDTNNSTEDFVRRNGQTPYPKGWRDQK